MHATLAVVLLVGPAFLGQQETETPPLIDFIPYKTLEKSMSGGGNPNVPQTIPAPEPPKAPPKPRDPAPPVQREEPKPPKPEKRDPKPQADAKNTTWKPRKVVPDFTPARGERKRPSPSPTPSSSASKDIENAIAKIKSNHSGSVQVELRGPGGGGVPYAGFEQTLKSIYFNNWHEPSDATMENGVVKTSVTIARDGSVISARITQRSGDPAVDRSVQRVLDEVKFIAPFPEGAKESQRTYPLSFGLRAKRGLG